MAKINLYTTVSQAKISDYGHPYNESVNVYFSLDDDANLEHLKEIPTYADHSGEDDPDQRKWRGENHYLCFVDLPEDEPTEAQIVWMAKRHVSRAMIDLATIDERKPNNQVCNWAFSGLTPQEVSNRYGDGGRVFLSGGHRI